MEILVYFYDMCLINYRNFKLNKIILLILVCDYWGRKYDVD